MTEAERDRWAAERLEQWRGAREPEALSALLKWQRDRAYGLAFRILGQTQDAEDAVQQAFLKLLSRREGFADLDAFRAAVRRAVAQCAVDAARARRSRTDRERAMNQPTPHPDDAPPVHAERAEAALLLHEELQQLAEDERALLALCFQEGADLAEASEILAVPRETLRDRLARTLKLLRERLGKRGLMLSLLGVAGLFGQGAAHAAPARLCAALDAQLAGLPCAQVPVCPPAAVNSSACFAKAGLSLEAAPALGAKGLALTAAALVLATMAAVVAFSRQAPPAAAGPAPLPAVPATAPVIPAPKPAAAPAHVEPAPAADDKPAAPAVELPATVRAAMETAFPDFVPLRLETERRDGKKIYEIEGKAKGKPYEIVVDEDGRVLKIEADEPDEDDEAPKPPPKPSDEF